MIDDTAHVFFYFKYSQAVMLERIKITIVSHSRGRNHGPSKPLDTYFADLSAAVLVYISHTL